MGTSSGFSNAIYFYVSLGSIQGQHEKALLNFLLEKYQPLERPVKNESTPLQLSFGLTLMQIIDVVSEIELPPFPTSSTVLRLRKTNFK